MKVLLYLTIAALCFAQVLGAFNCTSTPLSGTACDGILSSYDYFDLNQLGFNVTVLDQALQVIFANVSASGLCSQCVQSLKAFYCLNVYPECVDSATVGKKPAIPCNDASCNLLLSNCVPGVFVSGSPIFNSALASPAYSSLSNAYTEIASGFVGSVATLFGQSATSCGGPDAIKTFLEPIVTDTLTCTSLSSSYSTVDYTTETCACTPFPSGTTYCQSSELGISNVAAIYNAAASSVDTAVQSGVASQAELFIENNLNCSNCDAGLRKYACSTAFLQCNPAGTNAAASFLFPCKDVGTNFLHACSINEVFALETSPLNPAPNATLAALLNATIIAANSLPSAPFCISQTYTQDSNCGCQALRQNDYCYAYITGVAGYLPPSALDAINLAVTTNVTYFQPLFDLYGQNCSTCVDRIKSAYCHSSYPACNPTTTYAPYCTTSCATELDGCKASELCNAFEAFSPLLSSDSGVCQSYTSTVPAACSSSLLPPFVQGCNDQTIIPVGDAVCNSYVGNSIMPLSALDPVAAAQIDIPTITAGLQTNLCGNCVAAMTETFCNMKYLKCTTYPANVTQSITISVPSWGCVSSLDAEFVDCAPPTVKNIPGALDQFVAQFSATFGNFGGQPPLVDSFTSSAALFNASGAQLEAFGVSYQCNPFNSNTSRQSIDICPCVTLDSNTTGGCSAFVNYQVSAMLNSPDVAAAALNNSLIKQLASLTCQDCADKITEFTCLAAFPQCIPSTVGYLPVNKSVCDDSLLTCRIQQFADPELTPLLSLLAVGLQITVPDISEVLSSCDFLPSTGFVPVNYTSAPECACETIPATSQCFGIITHPVVSFLANLDVPTRGALEGLVLGQSANVNSNCPACKDAVKRNLCTAAYPTCTASSIASLNCRSSCVDSVAFCDDKATAQGLCTALPLNVAFSDAVDCIPLNFTTDASCPALPGSSQSSVPSAASTLLPSLFFAVIVMLAKALF